MHEMSWAYAQSRTAVVLMYGWYEKWMGISCSLSILVLIKWLFRVLNTCDLSWLMQFSSLRAKKATSQNLDLVTGCRLLINDASPVYAIWASVHRCFCVRWLVWRMDGDIIFIVYLCPLLSINPGITLSSFLLLLLCRLTVCPLT